MASAFSEEDFTCPVCYDIFTDPVLLHCTHSVCKQCLKTYWQTIRSKKCPVCRRISRVASPPVIRSLKNLCDAFLQERSQKAERCDLQDRVKNELKLLQEKLKLFKERQLAWTQTAQHIESQALSTEKQIKEEFGKLHQFLHDKEAARISALRSEEEQKSEMMKENIKKLSSDIALLSDTIKDVEKEMSLDDVTFIRNYRTTLERSQLTLEKPEEPSGALIHVAEHLGNLKFNIWDKMQNIVQYTPITLDPNTAHPLLPLSYDLTRLRCSDEEQTLPDNPERFDECRGVLGSESFDSGTHCWDVEVGDNTMWIIGMISESAERKGCIFLRSGTWSIIYTDGKYGAQVSPHKFYLLSVPEKLRRIRVKLDWESGTLSFINLLNNMNILTIVNRFTEKLRPLFALAGNLSTLQILPLRKYHEEPIWTGQVWYVLQGVTEH